MDTDGRITKPAWYANSVPNTETVSGPVVEPVQIGQPSTTLTQPGSFPVCSSPNSDVDGDGYGWENEQTCLSVADLQPNTDSESQPVAAVTATTTPSNDSNIDAPVTFPICSSSVSDTDGDDTAGKTTNPVS